MSVVLTRQEAAKLNRAGTYGPYAAANGHTMIAPLHDGWPKDDNGEVREYRLGDVIRYDSWAAWCAPGCNHAELGPLEDW